MNGPFGGSVVDIVVHSSGATVAATNGNGLWRSTDQGGTWTKLTTGSDTYFNDLDIDPSGNIYAATNKIYKSSDGGATWVNLNSTGIGGMISKIRAASSSKIYVGLTNNFVYKSINSGATFSVGSSFGSLLTDMDVSPANTEIVYASTSQGVKVSEDGGFSFSFTSSGSISSSETVYSLVVNSTGVAFALTSSGPHKKTAVSGSNVWASIKGTITDTNFSGDLAFDASEILYLANGNTKKVYTGNTTGTAWNSGASFPAHIEATRLSVITSTNWLLASYVATGIFKTTTAGASSAMST